MREHQIIINLRPEHYQELERLSRVAGSRSVSIFVKERILASLGIANGSASAGSGSANMAAVTADIRRLHRDLQVFVAESLSGKDFGYVSGDPSNLVEQQLSNDIPDFAVPQGEEPDEQSRDFENEPPLSPQQKAVMPPVPMYPDVPGAPRILPVTSNGAPPAVSLPASSSPQSAAVPPSLPSDQAIPRPKLPDFPITQPIPRVSSPFGPITGANVPSMLSGTQSTQGQSTQAQPPQAPAVQPQTPQQAASTPSVQQPSSNLRTGPARDANVPDDLEELAERAFAISPRLGAMDEIDDDKPMFSDPLDELLGDMDDDEPIGEPPPPPTLAAPSPQQQSRRPAPAPIQPVTSEPLKRDFAEEVMRLAKEAEQAQESQQAQNVQLAHQIQLSPSANDDEDDPDEKATPDEEDLAAATAVKQQSASGANPALALSEPSPPPPPPTEDDDDNGSDNSSNTQAQTETSPADAGSDSASSGESDQSSTQNPPPISGGPPPRRRRT